MAREFEKAIGWEGPPPDALIGRDITSIEQGEERRGPICNAGIVFGEINNNTYALVVFRTAWEALKEGNNWHLECEPDDPERGIFCCFINPEYIHAYTNPSTGVIRFSKWTIHRKGDNIPKPEIPTIKPYKYIFGA